MKKLNLLPLLVIATLSSLQFPVSAQRIRDWVPVRCGSGRIAIVHIDGVYCVRKKSTFREDFRNFRRRLREHRNSHRKHRDLTDYQFSYENSPYRGSRRPSDDEILESCLAKGRSFVSRFTFDPKRYSYLCPRLLDEYYNH